MARQTISIRSDEFLNPIRDALNLGMSLVIFHQFAYRGGYQEWHVIHRIEQLDAILNTGQHASAFTAYEWRAEAWPQVANAEWLTLAKNILAQQSHDILVWYEPFSEAPARLSWIGEADGLDE